LPYRDGRRILRLRFAFPFFSFLFPLLCPPAVQATVAIGFNEWVDNTDEGFPTIFVWRTDLPELTLATLGRFDFLPACAAVGADGFFYFVNRTGDVLDLIRFGTSPLTLTSPL